MSSSAVSTEATPQSDSGFVKAMTLTDATMLVAGSMIGSGIFIVSASMARDLPSPLWMIIAWILSGVMTLLGARRPESLAICALLDKQLAPEPRPEVRFVGFRAPPAFLVGYGLDHAENYRHLPFIADLE
jgi:hypothetical protein